VYSDPAHRGLTQKIENAGHEYFSSLELPDYPTVYDHLLLSLRRKDAIFTFNWDPFLFVRAPEISGSVFRKSFLHGNVRVGHCPLHPTRRGAQWLSCPDCGARFVPTKLLYPIRNKNYASDEFIASEWRAANWYLESAFT
jgi:hypothetical protein